MKRFLAIIAIVLFTSSCALLGDIQRAEKNNPGGYLDEKADKLITVANTPEMRTLRAYAMLASLATIAEDIGLRKSARESVANQIIGASNNIDIAKTCASKFKNGDVCLFFDSKMVNVSRDIYDITVSILPIDELRQIIANPSNILSSSKALINLADVIIPTTFRAYAIYRDVWHINYLTYVDYLTRRSAGTPTEDQFSVQNGSVMLNGFSSSEYDEMKNEIIIAYESSINEFIRLVSTGNRNSIIEEMTLENTSKNKYLQLSREVSPAEKFFSKLKTEIKMKCNDLVSGNKKTNCNRINP